MYAIIKTGGKQYKVTEGDEIYIEKLNAEESKNVTFDEVVVLGKDSKLVVGDPTVKGASVEAEVLKQGKAKKIQKEKWDIDNLILRLRFLKLLKRSPK